MSLTHMISEENSQDVFTTSSGGMLAHARKIVILVAGALQSTGGSANAQEMLKPAVSVYGQTSSGIKTASELTTRSAIMEVRRLSGLTWEQLSDLLSVARRSLHFWASGKRLNAPNEERVSRLLACIRFIARDSARETRTLLLRAQPDGQIPIDLLSRGEFEEVASRLGPGGRAAERVYSDLSPEAWAARRPPPPESLIGALDDEVTDKKTSYARLARSAKFKRK